MSFDVHTHRRASQGASEPLSKRSDGPPALSGKACLGPWECWHVGWRSEYAGRKAVVFGRRVDILSRKEFPLHGLVRRPIVFTSRPLSLPR